jgi:hypothetical protein
MFIFWTIALAGICGQTVRFCDFDYLHSTWPRYGPPLSSQDLGMFFSGPLHIIIMNYLHGWKNINGGIGY